MLINIVKMYKLWQFRIPSSLSQRFVNHLKVYKNNLESPVLPKLFHDVRSYCYTRSHENGKKMEILLEHIEQMKSSLNIDRNKLIVPTFTNVKKIGGVRSRRNNAAFECSLSVKLPSELSSMSFRCMGRGLTKELAKKSAINIFIRASSVSNRKLNTDNETIKRSSIRNQHIIQKGYSLTGVNALRDLHGQTSRSPARIQERLLKFKNTPSITSTDTHRYYSQNAAEFKEKEEKTVSSDVCVADRHTFQEILKAYPAPRNRLSNFFNSLEQSLGQNNLIKMSSKQLVDCNSWEYRYKLAWPMTAEFIGKAATKKEAARNAALKALHWLKVLGKIDLKGNLYTIDKKEFVKQETKKAIAVIKLKEDFIEETESLVEEFDQEFSVRLHETCSQWNEMDKPSYFDTGVPRFEDLEAPQSVLDRRNNELLDALSRRKRQGSSLPITDYGSVIVNLVRDNSVLVIKGEPGCGKSTQVPQMIFDDCTERLEGTKCNIVVTQPRKISAISIAERIAQERNEQIGDVVGYQVRFASKLPRFRDGNIVFCTLGIMLRKLLSPDGMRGITHLIIDEAHERDLNTDIMLLLAKRAIENNPNLRIIIMSATINPELFQNYFNNAPSLHVPGFTHPVKSNFLDNNMEKALRLTVDDLKKGVDQPGVNPQLITKMVNWVDANRPPGAILVFLPGWDTIRKVRDELEGYRGLFVVPVHSRLSHDDQRKIFMQPPRSMRKVVLATNIAETSITINDVIYVIDSGLLKEKRLSSKDGLSSLDNNWASKASVIQRKGRAGRVQPGECFHLYTKEKYETFDKFPMPEVHRIRLETVVLQSKTYSGHEKAEEFLSQLPEPPNVMVIREAVKTLQFIGALDEDEDLTPLGHRISIFTTHPLISKALVYSYFFKCVNPLVTIGTIFSSEMELFPGMAFDKSRIRDGKCRFSPSSDHIALAWLFQQWAEYLATNEYKAKQLMEDILGSHQNFLFVKRLQELVADHLRQCQLTPRTGALFAKKSDCNAYVFNDELIKGVFLSGVGNLLISRKYTLKKGVIKKTPSLVTQEGHKSIIAGESVNHRRTEFPSPLIAYFQEMHSAQNGIAMIRDTSIVSPVTVALFQPGTLSVIKPKGFDVDASEDVNLQLKSKITFNFACDERTATALVKLREAMWSVIDYFVMECGNPNDLTFYREVNGFHKKVLNLLNRVLLEEGTRLDYDENGNLRKAPGKKYP